MFVKTGLVLFVFSSGSGCWSVLTSTSWDALSLDVPKVPYGPGLEFRRYVYGCFYWKLSHMNRLLKLDMETMKFSIHDLPPDQAEQSVVVVEAGDGKLAMFSQIGQGTSLGYYTFLQNGCNKGGEWCLKKAVWLPSQFECNLIDRHAEGHIFLFGVPKVEGIPGHVCFSVDIKTFRIETLNGINYPAIDAPYSGFPPIISPRRIQGYEVEQDSIHVRGSLGAMLLAWSNGVRR